MSWHETETNRCYLRHEILNVTEVHDT